MTDAPAPPPPGSARGPRLVRGALGVLVLLASGWPVINHYLLQFPDEIWLVDLEVYREGARSLVEGRPVYDWLTDNPQYLPFTYPPFAALMGTVMLLAPFPVIGWLWTAMQFALLWVCTGIAFRPFLARFPRRHALVQGAVAAVLIHLQPLQEGIRFGQVNSILVTLCLVDVARRRAGWWPRGSLTGIAAAVKLTPAVFWVHYALARRWRALGVSVGVAAAATLLTAVISPSSSAAYWTDALLDPGRLGPNANTANQSMRGVLLRTGLLPEGSHRLTAVWLLLVVVVAVFGFRLALRLDRLEEPVAVVGVLGMLAVLLSPVSWVHHVHWGIVVIGALLGDARVPRRVLAALAGTTMLWFNLPWDGYSWERHHDWTRYPGYVLEQGYCWFALLALLATWWLLARSGRRPGPTSAAGPPLPEPARSASATGRTDPSPVPRR
ncbi:MAG TPA: glycosyltransferase 87 family protein [Kineosporiaceae bacterium]